MTPKAGLFLPKVGIVLAVATFVAGCATPAPVYERWLTEEEDAALRAQCEHAQCVMVPGEIWARVLQVLRGDKRI